MAWTVAFSQDTESKGVGTATAVESETGTTYARRVDTNTAKDVSDFCTEAKAVLSKQQTAATERATYISKVFAELTK